jgi:hypothetical protein
MGSNSGGPKYFSLRQYVETLLGPTEPVVQQARVLFLVGKSAWG